MADKHVPSLVRELSKRVVDDSIWPFLKANDFERRTPRDFIRWRGECRCRVTATFDKARQLEEGFLDLQLTVGFQGVWNLLADCPQLASLFDTYRNEPFIASLPLGNLKTPPDGAIYLEAGMDPASVGEQIVEDIRVYGIDWMDRLGSREAAARYLESLENNGLMINQRYFLAAIYVLTGDYVRSRATILTCIEMLRDNASRYRSYDAAEKIDEAMGVLVWLNRK